MSLKHLLAFPISLLLSQLKNLTTSNDICLLPILRYSSFMILKSNLIDKVSFGVKVINI